MAKLAAAVVSVLWAGAATAADDVDVRHFERLLDYSVQRTGATGVGKVSPVQTTEISFSAFGRAFTLLLEPNARVPSGTPGVTAYRGRLAGVDGSWARIVLTDAGPAGLLFDGTTLLALETPADTAVADPEGPIAYRLEDVYLAPGTLQCAAEATSTAAETMETLAQEVVALEALGATLNLDLGVLVDAEFMSNFTSDDAARAAVMTRINNIDGIFSEQLGVQITAAEVELFRDDEHFTATDPSELLQEVAIYRGTTPRQDSLGLTHLITGRDLDGGTAGIAYIGSLCSRRNPFDSLGRSFGVSLSESRRGTALDSLIAAHEIGHNFGAPHDAEAGSACESTPDTFLMATRINGSREFSACSIEHMQPEIESAQCLTPIGRPDLEVTSTETERSELAGVAFEHTLAVRNLGIQTATGVGVSVTADAGLAIDAAAASAGSCTVAGREVECALGDLPGGSARNVTLTMRGTVPGQHALAASVTADTDADTGNNELEAVVTVLPVVDLRLAGGSGTVVLNGRTTLAATLRNAGDFTAGSVSLSVELSAGLRADAVTFDGRPCTVSGAAVSCPARPLGAGGTAAIALTVTGTATGTQRISLAASSAEAERNRADNTLVLSVNVTSPPPSDDSGSGGSAGGNPGGGGGTGSGGGTSNDGNAGSGGSTNDGDGAGSGGSTSNGGDAGSGGSTSDGDSTGGGDTTNDGGSTGSGGSSASDGASPSNGGSTSSGGGGGGATSPWLTVALGTLLLVLRGPRRRCVPFSVGSNRSG